MPSPKVIISMPMRMNHNSRIIFSDINYETASISNDELSYNIKSIGQSLMTILSTYKGQRLFHPTFGSNLEMFLFDPVDHINANNIRDEIVSALTTWENRIYITERSVVVTAILDEEYYLVNLTYSIPALEEESSVSFNLAKGGR